MSKRATKPIISKREATWAKKWFLVRFGIEDWKVKIFLSDRPPPGWERDVSDDWLGGCEADRRHKIANIWVPRGLNEKAGVPVLQSLFHELVHVMAADIGIKDDGDDEKEYQWDRIAMALYELYIR